MKGANIVGLDDPKLTEISEATANAAVATIAGYATSRDDLRFLLDAIRPTPHTVGSDPSQRRAAPRRGAER